MSITEIYNTVQQITNEATAKSVITILIDYFDFYVSFEEIQKFHIR